MGGGVDAENNGEALVEDDKMGKKQKVNNDEGMSSEAKL